MDEPVLNISLSPRQKQILELLACGRTEKGAAKELGISWRTVGVHTRDARAKLQVESTRDAILVAMRYGLIAVDKE